MYVGDITSFETSKKPAMQIAVTEKLTGLCGARRKTIPVKRQIKFNLS